MRRLTLPRTNRTVSTLCFGAGPLGAEIVGADAERLVADFIAGGGNFFDTAHCYAFWTPAGAGCSERELGRTLRALGADDAVVMTKGGHPAMDGYSRTGHFLSPQVVRGDIDDSRERLGLETIPLFLLHRDDGVTPVGEVIEMLAAEIARGAIGAFGASNWSVARLAQADAFARAHQLPGFVVSEIQGSLAIPNWQPTADPTVRYLTDAELAWHAENGIPIVAYSATAGGYFGDNPGAERLYGSPENAARRARAREIAARRGVSPAQIAIAYLLALPVPTIPLFGTTKRERLAEIVRAESLALSPEEARWLRDG